MLRAEQIEIWEELVIYDYFHKKYNKIKMYNIIHLVCLLI